MLIRQILRPDMAPEGITVPPKLVKGTLRMGNIAVPKRRHSDRRALHREMAEQLRRQASGYRTSQQSVRESRLRDHPVADCPDLDIHLRHARRAIRTRRRLTRLTSRC